MRLATGAALGLVAGLAIPHAKKALMQGPSVAAGDWVAALTAEHRMVQALFDKLLATDDSQALKRGGLLMKIAYALTKHAIEEENVIYPAMAGRREADKDHLVRDHGEIKTFLYELKTTPAGDPGWRALAMEFRNTWTFTSARRRKRCSRRSATAFRRRRTSDCSTC